MGKRLGQQGQAAKQRREGKALALCAFPASWFTGLLAVALPGVADIRLFYAAAAVFFGCNAATVGSAESMPFCLLTAGDLSRLLWVHPKWPGLALGEMLLLCLPTAFFFASVAALVGSLSPPRAPGHPGVLPVVAGGAAHPQPAAPARGGVCLSLPALCRGPARRLAVE